MAVAEKNAHARAATSERVGDGAGGDAADQDVDAGVQAGRERIQRQSSQRQDIGELPQLRAVETESQRRQQQDRSRNSCGRLAARP